jgi:hypothetical protein
MPDPEDVLRSVARQTAGMSASLRVLGVGFVLLALPYAATGYGLLVAWAPVWLGVLLWQAASASASGENGEPDLPRLMRKLRRFFVGFSLLVAVMFVLAAVLATVPRATVVDALSAAGL